MPTREKKIASVGACCGRCHIRTRSAWELCWLTVTYYCGSSKACSYGSLLNISPLPRGAGPLHTVQEVLDSVSIQHRPSRRLSLFKIVRPHPCVPLDFLFPPTTLPCQASLRACGLGIAGDPACCERPLAGVRLGFLLSGVLSGGAASRRRTARRRRSRGTRGSRA